MTFSKPTTEWPAEWRRTVWASPTPCLTLATLALGEGATHVVDVGAREAGAEVAWWQLDGLARQFGFEPAPDECARLNAGATQQGRAKKFFPVALAERPGVGTLHLTQDPACASLYPPDAQTIARYPDLEVAREVGRMQVEMSTMDTWWNAQSRPDIGFIKLDTQGSEVDILRGGVATLQDTVGCEIEVEFTPIYQGQPLFAETDAFMRSQGFSLWRLYGLCHYLEDNASAHGRRDTAYFGARKRVESEAGSGRLFWANAIYFRDRDDAVYARRPERLFLLLALLEACRDYDGAAAVLRQLMARGMVQGVDAELFDRITRPPASLASGAAGPGAHAPQDMPAGDTVMGRIRSRLAATLR